MSKSRNWCYTLCNYTEDDLVGVEDAVYTIYGKEVGEEGTPHLQGFCHFANPRALGGVKKLLPRAHLEPMRGNLAQAITYCQKDNDWTEYGTKPMSSQEKGQANADRWTDIIELSRRGDYETVKEKYPDVYATRLPTLENLHRKRPINLTTLDGELENLWVVGETGVGKSKWVREQFPDAYIKDPRTRWWDTYDHQETVIIDDFDKYQVAQGGDMKRWGDRYVVPVEVKGGYMNIRPKRVIVTSQYTPKEIWHEDAKTLDAMERRFHLLEMMTAEDAAQQGLEEQAKKRWTLGSLTAAWGQSGVVSGMK